MKENRRKRREFTPEFKAEVVGLCGVGDRSIGRSCEANPTGTEEEAQAAVTGMYTMMVGWLGDALKS